MAVYHPAKATLPVNDTITITDSAGIIDDENAVYEALEEFQDISGVTVCIETVYDRTWAGSSKYYSLEDYAYSSYVNTFDDEKHWLFVMSFPEDYETCEFVNWRFEGMIGDDFFYTISSESEDRITKLLNDALLRYAPEHVDSAIVEAFDKFGDTVLDVQVNWILVVVGFIFLFLYIFAILGFIIDYMDSHHVGNGVNVPNNARELKCSYCGNAYIVGTVIKCPSCGAPLSYKEQQNQ